MMVGHAEDTWVVLASGHRQREPCSWGWAWPYLECSWEALVASAWVQALVCLVGAEQLMVASVRENVRFTTDSPLFCLKRWQRDTGSSRQVSRVG